MHNAIKQALESIRAIKPLVLNLTNLVTMDFMANSLLSIGAAPIMAVEEGELRELVGLSHAINLNIGTLSQAFIEGARVAAYEAQRLHVPLVLDPVGAGATRLRTDTAMEFLPLTQIVRGNASEIIALDNVCASAPLGVEAVHESAQGLQAARRLALNYNCVIVVSGATDYVVSAKGEHALSFGSPLMPLVTGMGCTLTAVIAAFHAAIADPFEAATLATAFFGLCGEQAIQQAKAPGSFRTAFIDSLYAFEVKSLGS